jgi:hypothetical protein
LCHEAVSHFIFDNLCSFNLTAVPSFIAAIDAIVKFAPGGYKPPKPHLVRGKYLDAAYEKTQKKAKVLFGDMEHMCALAIMSGGKTNNGKVPIVNYIAKSPKGAHFLAAVDMGLYRRRTTTTRWTSTCTRSVWRQGGFEKSIYLCVLDGALRSAICAFLISYKHKQPASLSIYAHMWLYLCTHTCGSYLSISLSLYIYMPTTPGTALSVFYCSPLCLLF